MAEIIRKNKILDILKIHLKYILIIYLMAIIGGIVFYILSPKYYRSTAKILKPVITSQNIKTQSPQNVSSDIVSSLLESKEMLDTIIKKFRLSNEYGTQNMDILRQMLKENSQISQEGTKIITISVIDRNPKTAANIANFFWKNLEKLIYNLTTAPARKNRFIIEKNLEKTSAQIKLLEDKLNKLEHKSKIIIINNNTESITPVADYLMGKLVKEKINLEKIKLINPKNFREIASLTSNIKEIEKQIDKIIEYKKRLSGILRKISTEETVFSLLSNQVEKSKIAESKNIISIQVLDKAVASTRIYKPNIKLIIIIISSIVLGIGLIIIFFDALRFLGSL